MSHAPAKPTRTRRWFWLAALVLLLAAGGFVVRQLTIGPKGLSAPPVVDLDGIDPSIAKAIQAARQKVAEAPKSADAWGQLGMILHAHIFIDEAGACYTEAARRAPKDGRWPYLQANLQLSRIPDEAVPNLRRAVELTGDTPDMPRLRLADLLLLTDDRDGAAVLYQKLLDRDGRHVRARLGLARLAFLHGDDAGVKEYLPPCLDSEATRKAALTLRAEFLARAGDHAAAERDLAEARRTPDDRPWPDPWLTEVAKLKAGERHRRDFAGQLLDAGRTAEAVVALRELTRDYPETAANWVTLGFALLQARDWAAAEPALQKALALDPSLAKAWFYLGFAQHARSDRRAAIASFRAAIDRKPDYAVAHFNLGVTLQEEGDRPAAVAALRDALRCQPRQAPAHARLGDLLAQANQTAEAKDHLRQAMELNPKDEASKKLLDELSKR